MATGGAVYAPPPPAATPGGLPRLEHSPLSAVPAGVRAPLLPVLALVGVFLAWSNSFHAILYFRRELGTGALDLVTLRFGPLAPLCLAFCLLRRRALAVLLRREWWRVLALGALMVPAYNLALNWGQLKVPPATASLITVTNPVFTFLLAVAFLGERFRWSRVAGMTVAFLGVFLLTRSQQTLYGEGYSLYALVVLLAPLAWAGVTVLAKPAARRVDPLLLTFACLGVGGLPFLGHLLVGGAPARTLAAMPPLGWLALGHLSLLCTVVGVWVWNWALRHLSATTVAAFVFLNPPLTSLFGVVWGTEELHWTTPAFGTVTLLGVALSMGADLGRRRRER